MRRRLLEFYWAIERRLVPGLEYSQHRYEERLARWIGEEVVWLDVGCGRRLLPPWREEEERALVSRSRRLVGIDLDFDTLKANSVANDRVFGAIGQLPFPAESFDVVTANMVVEHLERPQEAFAEVARVLRPGGLFLFHTPNAKAFPTALARLLPDAIKAPLARVLDRRRSADVFPTHYRCNSAEDVERCGRAAGFVVAELTLVSTTALFSVVPPLAFLELLWIRFVQSDRRRALRSNILAVLKKA